MTNCHHCIQTKHLLNRLNINTKVVELDQLKNGIGPGVDSIAVALYNITGQYTVPNVFVKGNHLGGNDETQAAARSGQLQEMLRS
jgi:glutaredoxin 3